MPTARILAGTAWKHHKSDVSYAMYYFPVGAGTSGVFCASRTKKIDLMLALESGPYIRKAIAFVVCFDKLPCLLRRFSELPFQEDKHFPGNILQGAYIDTFGNRRPDRDKRKSKFRQVGFKYLHFLETTPPPSSLSTKSTRSIATQVSKVQAIATQPSITLTGRNHGTSTANNGVRSASESEAKQWPRHLLHFQSAYAVNEKKVKDLIERVKNNGRLKIFLSSPFSGCMKERDYFMKIVLPLLEQMAAPLGVYVQVVDMRWGITEQMGNNDLTLIACLDALKDSDIFIGYFGARYGSSNFVFSSPDKTWIDRAVEKAAEVGYEHMLEYKNLSLTHMEWMQAFLHKHSHPRPADEPICLLFYRGPEYDQDLRQRAESQATEIKGVSEKLAALLSTADSVGAAGEVGLRAWAEMTALFGEARRISKEIIASMDGKHVFAKALITSEEDQLTAGDRYAFARTVKSLCDSLQSDRVRKSKSYMVENAESAAAADGLKATVKALAAQPGLPVAVFDGYKDPREGGQLMGECCQALMRNIAEVLEPLTKSVSATQHQHSMVAKSLLRGVYTAFAENLMRHVKKCLSDPPSSRPLIISGQSGCGKSCFMADLFLNQIKKLEDAKAAAIMHYVGCTADSMDLTTTLQRITDECYTILSPHLPQSYPQLPKLDSLSVQDLLMVLVRLYEDKSIADSLPTIIILIDGFDQMLDEPYDAETKARPSGANWFPKQLPPKLKVVITCLSGAFLDGICMQCEIDRKHILYVRKLNEEQRRAVIQSWCKKLNKTMDEEVADGLAKAQQCSNILFLSLCLNFLVLGGSFAYFKAGKWKEVLTFQTVPDLLVHTITAISKVATVGGESASAFIRDVLCAVLCSPGGMPVADFIELVHLEQRAREGQDAEPLLDQASWMNLEYLLHLFLKSHRGVLLFTHDYVRKAVETLYITGAASSSAGVGKAIEGAAGVRGKKEGAHLDPKVAMAKRLAILYKYLAMEQMVKGGGSSEAALKKIREPLAKMRMFKRLAKIRPGLEVAVRVRPMNVREIMKAGADPTECVVVHPGKISVTCPTDERRTEAFDFDYALDSSCDPGLRKCATQEKIFKVLGEDIVEDVLAGVNVTLLAYGQSSSGKSYTIFGSREKQQEHGLFPRILDKMVEKLTAKEQNQEIVAWTLGCTMLEVHKDNVFDLLADRDDDVDDVDDEPAAADCDADIAAVKEPRSFVATLRRLVLGTSSTKMLTGKAAGNASTGPSFQAQDSRLPQQASSGGVGGSAYQRVAQSMPAVGCLQAEDYGFNPGSEPEVGLPGQPRPDRGPDRGPDRSLFKKKTLRSKSSAKLRPGCCDHRGRVALRIVQRVDRTAVATGGAAVESAESTAVSSEAFEATSQSFEVTEFSAPGEAFEPATAAAAVAAAAAAATTTAAVATIGLVEVTKSSVSTKPVEGAPSPVVAIGLTETTAAAAAAAAAGLAESPDDSVRPFESTDMTEVTMTGTPAEAADDATLCDSIDHIREESVEHMRREPVEHIRGEPVEHMRREPVEHMRREPVEHIRGEPVESAATAEFAVTEPVQLAESEVFKHIKAIANITAHDAAVFFEDTPSAAATAEGTTPHSVTKIFSRKQIPKSASQRVRGSAKPRPTQVGEILTSKKQRKPAVEIQALGVKPTFVRSSAEVEALQRKGEAARVTRATNMHDNSSRSHCILTVEVCMEMRLRQKEGPRPIVAGSSGVGSNKFIKARINFVDLAGSERLGKAGVVDKQETVSINSSLSCLHRCLSALADPSAKFVPYRDSKLTRLLQNSLGGSARTLLVAAVSPSPDNYSETLETLRFAALTTHIAVDKNDEELLRAERQRLEQQKLAQLNDQDATDEIEEAWAAEEEIEDIDVDVNSALSMLRHCGEANYLGQASCCGRNRLLFTGCLAVQMPAAQTEAALGDIYSNCKSCKLAGATGATLLLQAILTKGHSHPKIAGLGLRNIYHLCHSSYYCDHWKHNRKQLLEIPGFHDGIVGLLRRHALLKVRGGDDAEDNVAQWGCWVIYLLLTQENRAEWLAARAAPMLRDIASAVWASSWARQYAERALRKLGKVSK